jgi:plastocyanin
VTEQLVRFAIALALITASLSGALSPARAGDLAGRVTVGRRPVRDAVLFVEELREPPVRGRKSMDQRNRTFIPHVMAIQLGTRVDFPNHDTVFHNVFSFREGKRFDLGLYPVGKTIPVTFDRPGLVRIFCNIHSNMSAFIWVVENPYFAVTDRAGRFRIADVPPGARGLRVWHERLGTRRLSLQIPSSGARPLEIDLGSS